MIYPGGAQRRIHGLSQMQARGGASQSSSSNGNDKSIGDVEMVPVENPMLKSKPEVTGNSSEDIDSNRGEGDQDNEHSGESRKRTASSI